MKKVFPPLICVFLFIYKCPKFVRTINTKQMHLAHLLSQNSGSTPLHFCKSVAALKLLLEADPKVDINVIDENSTTAFTQLLAIRDMDETTFNVLVEEYGADVHRRNIRLESPLHFAARFGRFFLFFLFFPSFPSPPPPPSLF